MSVFVRTKKFLYTAVFVAVFSYAFLGSNVLTYAGDDITDKADVTEPTTEPTTDPATDPATESATDPTTNPTTEPITEPTTDPATEPATDPSTNPTTEPTTEPATDPTTDPTADPATDPATEPATDPTTDPAQTNAQTLLQTPSLRQIPQGNQPGSDQGQGNNTSYTYGATLFDNDESHHTPDYDPQDPGSDRPGGAMPGVYVVNELHINTGTAEDFSDAPTIGIPSIADQNLEDAPTLESPAIIQGAAVGYENRLSPVEYQTIDPDNPRPEPYADYKVIITEQPGPDGTMQKKPTGFDQSYVIVRLDVSEIMQYVSSDSNTGNAGGQGVSTDNGTDTDTDSNTNAAATTYLHIKQEDNSALIPGAGMESKSADGITNGGNTFTTQMGVRTGAYSLEYLLRKATDTITGVIKPYVDVLLFATSSIVAGGDAGKEGIPTGDVKLQMYVDDTLDYNPELEYDPMSTDPNHDTNCLAKFFDAAKTEASKISRYLIKGSDLKLEVAVKNSGGTNKDTGTTFWSLTKAFEKPYYDLPADASPADPGCGRDIKLISEVAIVNGLTLTGTDADHLKKRTLDVNSFDVQVAKNSSGGQGDYPAGFTLQNAWLMVKDSSNTTGSEMAIGNNARFVIDNGGRLIIDETCQLEVEWDGGTTTNPDGTPAPNPDILNNGVIELRAGGTIQNNGIITIEGFEGKPYAPGTQPTPVAGCGELTISQGATLINNGCLLANGRLYNLGTIVNNGRYTDVIVSDDPDKGRFEYHKGIQVSWKDDVTQQGVIPGEIYNGQRGNEVAPGALIKNLGDIVLIPGSIFNYATIDNNNGNIYMGAAIEAIIPVEPTTANPTVAYKRIDLNPPKESIVRNISGGTISGTNNIKRVYIKLNDNLSYGTMTIYDTVEPSADDPNIWEMKNYNGYVIPGREPGKPEQDFTPEPYEESEGVPFERLGENIYSKNDTGDGSGGNTATEDSGLILEVFDSILTADGLLSGEGAQLRFYRDGRVEISLPGGKKAVGRYVFRGDMISFVLENGTVLYPTIDENGNYIFRLVLPDGTVITIVLKADIVLKLLAVTAGLRV